MGTKIRCRIFPRLVVLPCKISARILHGNADSVNLAILCQLMPINHSAYFAGFTDSQMSGCPIPYTFIKNPFHSFVFVCTAVKIVTGLLPEASQYVDFYSWLSNSPAYALKVKQGGAALLHWRSHNYLWTASPTKINIIFIVLFSPQVIPSLWLFLLRCFAAYLGSLRLSLSCASSFHALWQIRLTFLYKVSSLSRLSLSLASSSLSQLVIVILILSSSHCHSHHHHHRHFVASLSLITVHIS